MLRRTENMTKNSKQNLEIQKAVGFKSGDAMEAQEQVNTRYYRLGLSWKSFYTVILYSSIPACVHHCLGHNRWEQAVFCSSWKAGLIVTGLPIKYSLKDFSVPDTVLDTWGKSVNNREKKNPWILYSRPVSWTIEIKAISKSCEKMVIMKSK